MAALALVTGSRVYLSLALKDVGEPFAQILVGETLKWALWLPVVPLVVLVDRRWGFDELPFAAALLPHALLATAVLVVHTLVMTAAGQAADWYFAQESARTTALIRLVHEGATALLVYGGIVGLDQMRRHRLERDRARFATTRLEAQLATERLRNLQGQLHPHFLFNALHAVAGLLRDGERDRAVETVTKLGGLLRTSLRQADRQRVPLAEELEFLEAYMDIQKARHGEQLDVTWRVDPGLGDVLVPHLVLQPLVENAVRHGVDRALGGPSPPGSARIEIVAREEGGRLVLEVLDNGPGISADGEAGEGVGLPNTRSRLESLYGQDYTLKVESLANGKTRSRVEIPLETEGMPA